MYNVMIVDDEQSIKRSLKSIINFDSSRFQVVQEAEDGREALSLTEQFQPDVIITDVKMPVLDGIHLVKEIRSRNYQVEIVIISGYSNFDYAKQAMKFDVLDYLLKPLDEEEVLQTLQRIEQKLENKRFNVTKSTEITALFKTRCKQMTQYLWGLNDERMLQDLAGIHGELAQFQLDGNQLKEYYLQLLLLVQDELKLLSSGRMEVDSIGLEQMMQEPFSFEQIKQMLLNMMENVRETRNWANHHLMSHAIEYIDMNFNNETLCLKDTAEIVGMSPTYFSKSFKDELGMNYTEYLAKLRMEKSVELLEDPYHKVYEVAYAVGYSNYAHFAKVFKKTYGLSPSEFRSKLHNAVAN